MANELAETELVRTTIRFPFAESTYPSVIKKNFWYHGISEGSAGRGFLVVGLTETLGGVP